MIHAKSYLEYTMNHNPELAWANQRIYTLNQTQRVAVLGAVYVHAGGIHYDANTAVVMLHDGCYTLICKARNRLLLRVGRNEVMFQSETSTILRVPTLVLTREIKIQSL